MTVDDYDHLAEQARSLWPETAQRSLAQDAWLALLPEYVRRAREDGVNGDYFYEMIGVARRIVEEFVVATQAARSGGETALWRHRTLGMFSNLEPKTDIDVKTVKRLCDEYIAAPMIRTPFLDWCFVDALLFGEVKAFGRMMVMTQFGSAPGNPAYFMAKGDERAYRVLRPAFAVLGVLANYVAPAVAGYFLTEMGHEVIGGVFYAISAMGILSYVGFFSRRRQAKERNEKLLAKSFELYDCMKDETLPSARLETLMSEVGDLGVKLDRSLLTIIRTPAEAAS